MKFKQAICGTVLFILIILQVSTANATTYGTASTTGSYEFMTKGTFLGYTHYICKNTQGWIAFYPTKKLTAVIYHTKNRGSDDLTFSHSQTESSTQTVSWSTNSTISTNMGTNVFLFIATIGTATSRGIGESSTSGYEYTQSYQVTKTIESSAKTGYFCRVPGYTYYRMRSLIENNSKNTSDTIYYVLPYGSSVVYTVYSQDNNRWAIY